MKVSAVNVMGMPLEQWEHMGCTAQFGIGEDWATLFSIESKYEGNGYATELLKKAKEYYEAQGKRFGGYNIPR